MLGTQNHNEQTMNLSGSVKINKCGMLLLAMCLILLFYYFLFSGSVTDRQHKQYAYLMRNPNEVNLRKLLIGGIQAAQMGGIEVVAVSVDIKTSSKGKTKEGANDPVTNADLRSHCVMQYGLQRLFPRVKIISEEDATRKDCPDANSFELDPTVLDESVQDTDDRLVNVDDVTVWIDPLDATQEYTGACYLSAVNYTASFIFTPHLPLDRIAVPICHNHGVRGRERRTDHRYHSQPIHTANYLGMER